MRRVQPGGEKTVAVRVSVTAEEQLGWVRKMLLLVCRVIKIHWLVFIIHVLRVSFDSIASPLCSVN